MFVEWVQTPLKIFDLGFSFRQVLALDVAERDDELARIPEETMVSLTSGIISEIVAFPVEHSMR